MSTHTEFLEWLDTRNNRKTSSQDEEFIFTKYLSVSTTEQQKLCQQNAQKVEALLPLSLS